MSSINDALRKAQATGQGVGPSDDHPFSSLTGEDRTSSQKKYYLPILFLILAVVLSGTVFLVYGSFSGRSSALLSEKDEQEKAETSSEPMTETKVATKIEPRTVTRAAEKAVTKVEPKTVTRPVTRPVTRAAEKVEPKVATKAETRTAAPRKAAPRTTASKPAAKPVTKAAAGANPGKAAEETVKSVKPQIRLKNLKEANEHFNRGKSAMRKGLTDMAVAEYRMALKLDPRMKKAFLNLGNIFFHKKKNPERASQMYRQVLRIDPKDKMGHNNLGVILLSKDLLDLAEAEFNEAIKADSEFVDALYNMTCLMARKGKKSEAMVILRKVINLKDEARTWAAVDMDLASLKDLDEFKRLIKAP